MHAKLHLRTVCAKRLELLLYRKAPEDSGAFFVVCSRFPIQQAPRPTTLPTCCLNLHVVYVVPNPRFATFSRFMRKKRSFFIGFFNRSITGSRMLLSKFLYLFLRSLLSLLRWVKSYHKSYETFVCGIYSDLSFLERVRTGYTRETGQPENRYHHSSVTRAD